MRDAFIHGIRTPLHSYIFDVNTNRLIRIDDPKVYRMIVEGQRTDGYRVSQIGARSYCELFGFHSFPAFMYDPTVDETQKILLFNRFVYAVCREEKPDILLLTIPGGIQGLNERHPNGFGMLAFQVSKAVTADYLALCTFYETRVNAFAEMVRTACQYKLGRAVDCFHMSNIFINLSRTEERDAVQLDTVSREMVDKELRSKQGTYTRPIVNALEPEGLQALYDSVIQTLASDNDVMN